MEIKYRYPFIQKRLADYRYIIFLSVVKKLKAVCLLGALTAFCLNRFTPIIIPIALMYYGDDVSILFLALRQEKNLT